MLSSIVTAALAQAPDIAVAGRIDNEEDLAAGIRSSSADAVIVQTSHPDDAVNFIPLLRSFPALKIVAIDSTGRGGCLHQLRPYSIRLAELSADTLQLALRAPSGPIRRVRRL